MEVLKFGGTSVSSKKSLENMLRIIKGYDLEESPLIIVVSALKGITNELVNLIDLLIKQDEEYKLTLEIIKNKHYDFIDTLFDNEPVDLLNDIEYTYKNLIDVTSEIYANKEVENKDHDSLLSFGELFSARIITAYLQDNGLGFLFKDARSLILTDDTHRSAKVNWELTKKAVTSFFHKNKKSYVVTGFIASSIYGDTTTLGRGGSDYTATILGTLLKADKVTKWTDVNGIMTADPNKVSKANSLSNITYDELKSLSKFGANVLVHPESIDELSKHNIPFLIRNTFNCEFTGTQVINQYFSPQKALSLQQSCSLVSFEKEWSLPKELIKEILDKNYLFFRMKTPNSNERSYYVVADECVSFFDKETCKSESSLSLLSSVKNIEIVKRNIALITITSQSMDKKQELGRIKTLLNTNGISILGSRLFFNSISLIFEKGNFQEVLTLLHEELSEAILEDGLIL